MDLPNDPARRRVRIIDDAEDAQTRVVPIIILTGYPAMRGAHEAQAAGSDSYLTKPRLPATLAAEIRRLLARAD